MKFNTLLIALLFGVFYNGYSQKTTYDYFDQPTVYEVGISVGPMNSLTDVGGRRGNGTKGLKDLNFKNTNFSGGVSKLSQPAHAVARNASGETATDHFTACQ